MTAPVRLPAAFVAAFGRCARHFGWAGADLDEMKAACRADAEMRYYITRLAQALDDWYVPDAQNNYIRLDRWLAACGRPPLQPQRPHSLYPATSTMKEP